jgi:DtxR family Mn-dependent transcriptional regulator
MPTSTVEDYLKRIYLEEDRSADGVVAPGRIAQALGVAPGTVTAMMKTLTEADLVTYEPYAGVRLTPAGRKLAAHVLRRHRLIELFLVRVLGMDWSEVHQDAEVLEHAVSDRLLERIDEMLGRPAFDPHGDPIPTPTGLIPEASQISLRACPTGVWLRLARVTDQRAEFLQLLEKHRLKPGHAVRVTERDELTETVRVDPEEGGALQLGFRAAERIFVDRA